MKHNASLPIGWFIGLVVAFFLVIISVFWPVDQHAVSANVAATVEAAGYSHAKILFSDTSVKVQIPTTLAKQELGLGGRTSLYDNQGMYWVYDKPIRPAFWMKGMLIPLDFIWLRSGQVTQIVSNVAAPADPTSTNVPLIEPDQPIDGVLEVPAGFAQRHGVQVGDVVSVDLE